MKTVEERAEIIAQNSWHQSIATLKIVVIEALTEQDKITRHACAETAKTERIDYGGDSVTKLRNAIFQAIINTKAI